MADTTVTLGAIFESNVSGLLAGLRQVEAKLARMDAVAKSVSQAMKSMTDSMNAVGDKAGQSMNKAATAANAFEKSLQKMAAQGKVYEGAFRKITEGINKNSQANVAAAKTINQVDTTLAKLRANYSQFLQKTLGIAKGTQRFNAEIARLSQGAMLARASFESFIGKLGSGQAALAAFAAKSGNVSAAMAAFSASMNKSSRVAPQIKKMNADFDNLNLSMREMIQRAAELQAGMGKVGKGAKDAANGVKEQGKAFEALLQKAREYAKFVAGSAIVFGAIRGMKSGTDSIIEFSQALKNLEAISGATADDIALMAEKIKAVARQTKFSTSEIGEATVVLAQAGFSIGESLDAITSIANLATGTLSDMKTVSDLVTTAIRAFNVSTKEAGRVADVFANAINKSKLTIDKLQTSFNYIGISASQAGLAIEEVAASMMVLANNGMRASTIGTGLRQVIAKMLAPTQQFAEALRTQGVTLDDLNPKMAGYEKVLENLSSLLWDHQKAAVDMGKAYDFFRLRGAQAAAALVEGFMSGKYENAIAKTREIGTAMEMAATQAEGLAVKFKNAMDRAGNFAVAIGEAGLADALGAVADAMRLFFKAAEEFVSSPFGKISVQVTALVTSTTLLVKGLSALSAVIMKLSFAQYISSLVALAKAQGTATAATKAFSGALEVLAANKVVAVISAVGALALVLSKVTSGLDEASESAMNLSTRLGDNAKTISEYRKILEALAERPTDEYGATLKRFSAENEELAQKIRDMSGVADLAVLSFEKLSGSMKELEEISIIESIDKNAEALQRFFNMAEAYAFRIEKNWGLTKGMAEFFYSDDLARNIGQYEKAMDGLIVKLGELAKEHGWSAEAVEDYIESMSLAPEIAERLTEETLAHIDEITNAVPRKLKKFQTALEQLPREFQKMIESMSSANEAGFVEFQKGLNRKVSAIEKQVELLKGGERKVAEAVAAASAEAYASYIENNDQMVEGTREREERIFAILEGFVERAATLYRRGASSRKEAEGQAIGYIEVLNERYLAGIKRVYGEIEGIVGNYLDSLTREQEELVGKSRAAEEKIVAIRAQHAEDVRSIQRQMMTDEEKWIEERARANKLLSEGIASKDLEMMEEAASLFRGLARDVANENGEIAFSIEEASRIAQDGLAKTNEAMVSTLTEQQERFQAQIGAIQGEIEKAKGYLEEYRLKIKEVSETPLRLNISEMRKTFTVLRSYLDDLKKSLGDGSVEINFNFTGTASAKKPLTEKVGEIEDRIDGLRTKAENSGANINFAIKSPTGASATEEIGNAEAQIAGLASEAGRTPAVVPVGASSGDGGPVRSFKDVFDDAETDAATFTENIKKNLSRAFAAKNVFEVAFVGSGVDGKEDSLLDASKKAYSVFQKVSADINALTPVLKATFSGDEEGGLRGEAEEALALARGVVDDMSSMKANIVAAFVSEDEVPFGEAVRGVISSAMSAAARIRGIATKFMVSFQDADGVPIGLRILDTIDEFKKAAATIGGIVGLFRTDFASADGLPISAKIGDTIKSISKLAALIGGISAVFKIFFTGKGSAEKPITEKVSDIWSLISGFAKRVASIAAKFVVDFVSGDGSPISKGVDMVSAAFQSLKNWIGDLDFGWVSAGIGRVADAIQSLGGVLSGLYSKAASIASGMAASIKAVDIGGAIRSVVESAQSAFSGLSAIDFSGFFDFESLKGVAARILAFVKEIVATVKNFGLEKIGAIIGGPGSPVYDGIDKAEEKIDGFKAKLSGKIPSLKVLIAGEDGKTPIGDKIEMFLGSIQRTKATVEATKAALRIGIVAQDAGVPLPDGVEGVLNKARTVVGAINKLKGAIGIRVEGKDGKSVGEQAADLVDKFGWAMEKIHSISDVTGIDIVGIFSKVANGVGSVFSRVKGFFGKVFSREVGEAKEETGDFLEKLKEVGRENETLYDRQVRTWGKIMGVWEEARDKQKEIWDGLAKEIERFSNTKIIGPEIPFEDEAKKLADFIKNVGKTKVEPIKIPFIGTGSPALPIGKKVEWVKDLIADMGRSLQDIPSKVMMKFEGDDGTVDALGKTVDNAKAKIGEFVKSASEAPGKLKLFVVGEDGKPGAAGRIRELIDKIIDWARSLIAGFNEKDGGVKLWADKKSLDKTAADIRKTINGIAEEVARGSQKIEDAARAISDFEKIVPWRETGGDEIPRMLRDLYSEYEEFYDRLDSRRKIALKNMIDQTEREAREYNESAKAILVTEEERAREVAAIRREAFEQFKSENREYIDELEKRDAQEQGFWERKIRSIKVALGIEKKTRGEILRDREERVAKLREIIDREVEEESRVSEEIKKAYDARIDGEKDVERALEAAMEDRKAKREEELELIARAKEERASGWEEEVRLIEELSKGRDAAYEAEIAAIKELGEERRRAAEEEKRRIQELERARMEHLQKTRQVYMELMELDPSSELISKAKEVNEKILVEERNKNAEILGSQELANRKYEAEMRKFAERELQARESHASDLADHYKSLFEETGASEYFEKWRENAERLVEIQSEKDAKIVENEEALAQLRIKRLREFTEEATAAYQEQMLAMAEQTADRSFFDSWEKSVREASEREIDALRNSAMTKNALMEEWAAIEEQTSREINEKKREFLERQLSLINYADKEQVERSKKIEEELASIEEAQLQESRDRWARFVLARNDLIKQGSDGLFELSEELSHTVAHPVDKLMAKISEAAGVASTANFAGPLGMMTAAAKQGYEAYSKINEVIISTYGKLADLSVKAPEWVGNIMSSVAEYNFIPDSIGEQGRKMSEFWSTVSEGADKTKVVLGELSIQWIWYLRLFERQTGSLITLLKKELVLLAKGVANVGRAIGTVFKPVGKALTLPLKAIKEMNVLLPKIFNQMKAASVSAEMFATNPGAAAALRQQAQAAAESGRKLIDLRKIGQKVLDWFAQKWTATANMTIKKVKAIQTAFANLGRAIAARSKAVSLFAKGVAKSFNLIISALNKIKAVGATVFKGLRLSWLKFFARYGAQVAFLTKSMMRLLNVVGWLMIAWDLFKLSQWIRDLKVGFTTVDGIVMAMIAGFDIMRQKAGIAMEEFKIKAKETYNWIVENIPLVGKLLQLSVDENKDAIDDYKRKIREIKDIQNEVLSVGLKDDSWTKTTHQINLQIEAMKEQESVMVQTAIERENLQNKAMVENAKRMLQRKMLAEKEAEIQRKMDELTLQSELDALEEAEAADRERFARRVEWVAEANDNEYLSEEEKQERVGRLVEASTERRMAAFEKAKREEAEAAVLSNLKQEQAYKEAAIDIENSVTELTDEVIAQKVRELEHTRDLNQLKLDKEKLGAQAMIEEYKKMAEFTPETSFAEEIEAQNEKIIEAEAHRLETMLQMNLSSEEEVQKAVQALRLKMRRDFDLKRLEEEAALAEKQKKILLESFGEERSEEYIAQIRERNEKILELEYERNRATLLANAKTQKEIEEAEQAAQAARLARKKEFETEMQKALVREDSEVPDDIVVEYAALKERLDAIGRNRLAEVQKQAEEEVAAFRIAAMERLASEEEIAEGERKIREKALEDFRESIGAIPDEAIEQYSSLYRSVSDIRKSDFDKFVIDMENRVKEFEKTAQTHLMTEEQVAIGVAKIRAQAMADFEKQNEEARRKSREAMMEPAIEQAEAQISAIEDQSKKKIEAYEAEIAEIERLAVEAESAWLAGEIDESSSGRSALRESLGESIGVLSDMSEEEIDVAREAYAKKREMYLQSLSEDERYAMAKRRHIESLGESVGVLGEMTDQEVEEIHRRNRELQAAFDNAPTVQAELTTADKVRAIHLKMAEERVRVIRESLGIAATAIDEHADKEREVVQGAVGAHEEAEDSKIEIKRRSLTEQERLDLEYQIESAKFWRMNEDLIEGHNEKVKQGKRDTYIDLEELDRKAAEAEKRLAEDAAQRRVALEGEKRKAAVDTAKISAEAAESYAREIEQIDQAALEAKRKYFEEATAALKTELQKSLEMEKQIAQEIRDVRQSLADEQKSVDEWMREQRREDMGAQAAYADQWAEIQEKYQKAMAMGNDQYEKRRELIKEAMNEAKGMTSEVKEGEETLVSGEAARRRAMAEVAKMMEGLKQVDEARVQTLEKSQNDVEEHTRSVKESLAATEGRLEAIGERLDKEVTQGLDNARKKAQEFMDALEEGAEFKIDTTEAEKKLERLAEMAKEVKDGGDGGGGPDPKLKFATGGAVPGSGSGDTVPAMLTPNEHVIDVPTVQKFGGHGFFSWMRSLPKRTAERVQSAIRYMSAFGPIQPVQTISVAAMPRISAHQDQAVRRYSTGGEVTPTPNSQETMRDYGTFVIQIGDAKARVVDAKENVERLVRTLHRENRRRVNDNN